MCADCDMLLNDYPRSGVGGSASKGGCNMRITTAVLFAALVLAAGIGCSRKEAPAPVKAARVSATRAFESYFGPAPTTNKGTCYGFLIYFPAAKALGKVTPFPFFSFDESSLKKVALERIIGGMDEKRYAGEFLQLFPPGTRLLSLSEKNGTVSADFSKELGPVAGDPKRGRALYNAVALTLAQFSGVTGVRIQSEGRDLYPAAERLPAEATVVEQPSAPRLLSVIAMRQAPGAPVQEVDALFEETRQRFGRLDLLFNNAGTNVPGVAFEDLRFEDWNAVISVNLTGAFLCLQAAFRLMKAQSPQGGRIINNGSISAHSPRPDSAPYTASKHAITGLTKSASLDGRKFNIACGQIDIGNASTDMAARMTRGVPQANGRIEIEPVMTVASVGEAVVFMDSLPLEANVQFMTIMATAMPFVGRG